MMLRTIFSVLFTVFVGLVSSTASAQVVTTSTGSVEFLGLEKWTPVEIQKRLGYASSDQLHYCAADVKKLGFPEAAVIGYSEQGRRYAVVTVVEPDRAAEVVYKSQPLQHVSLPADWENLKKFVKEPDFLGGGILDYSRTLPGSLANRPWLAEGTPQTWWPTLRGYRKEGDFKRARQILDRADDPDARVVAAIVLMNFASEDVAWRNLASGLRDPNFLVQATCSQGLNSLATYHPRKVDWAPVIPDLIALLHGTELFAFEVVLKTLTVTKIDTALAGPLLGHGGARLVVAYLRAKHDEQRELAHAFLVQMAGHDLGNAPLSWEKWIASL